MRTVSLTSFAVDQSALAVQYREEEFTSRYEELKQYRIAIPPDPVALGFNGLADLISRVQGFKDRVSEMLNDAIVLKTRAKVQADVCQYAYEAAVDILVDTDPEISSLPSDRSRLARANKKLADKVAATRTSSLVHKMIEAYYRTVANVYANLESANRNLYEQCNLYKRMNPPYPFPGSAEAVPAGRLTVRTEL